MPGLFVGVVEGSKSLSMQLKFSAARKYLQELLYMVIQCPGADRPRVP